MALLKKMGEAARRLIDQHLDAIEVSLRASGISHSAQQSILEDVENQIYEMLEERITGTPQENEVRAVLAELDDPESYRSASDTGITQTVPSEGGVQSSTQTHLSKCAIFGAFWAIFFLVGVPFYLAARQSGYNLSAILGTFWWGFLQITAVSAPLGATLLGWIAMTQIRHSQGRLYGRGLSLFAAIVFPVIVVILLLLTVA